MLIQIARQLAALLLCLTLAVSGGEEGFLVGLRDQTEPDCWLCDVDGAALAPVPVGEDVTLGPLGPGRYQLRAGGALLGEFLLDRQAVILRAYFCTLLLAFPTALKNYATLFLKRP